MHSILRILLLKIDVAADDSGKNNSVAAKLGTKQQNSRKRLLSLESTSFLVAKCCDQKYTIISHNIVNLKT